MSLTPQDNARSTYSQAASARPPAYQSRPTHLNPSPAQPRGPFPHPHAAAAAAAAHQLRPPGPPFSSQQQYPLGSVAAGPIRQNGAPQRVSAEQQIAQGVLGGTTSATRVSTTPILPPQRQQPPSMATAMHMPPQPNGAPQQQTMTVNQQAMSVNSAINQPQSYNGQRQSQNASPANPNLNLGPPRQQQQNASPVHGNMAPQGPDDEQDMSLIDPQLAIDQQLSELSHPRDSESSHSHDDQQQLQSVPPGEMLSPPPQGNYPTFEALFAAAQNHALQHGYAFVIGRSKRDNRGLKKVFLICDRGGNNKMKMLGEERQRKTKSRKCGCTFGVYGLEGKQSWLLRGRIDGEHLTHNHPPSESITEHPGARKLDAKAIAAVKALEEAGVSVKETLEILHRDNPLVRYLPRDIYNARAAIKRDPSRVNPEASESLPTFYKKPAMTFEEKLRAELRTEVANAHAEVEKTKAEWKKEVEELKEKLRQKDKQIQKFEMFIDICNERVMVQRERLAEAEGSGGGNS